MQDGLKAVWSIPYVSVAFSPSLNHNFIAYHSSKVSSRPDCLFEIYQLWHPGFSRVYYCCSCSFEPKIIKIWQSSHKMYSDNILNFLVFTTILNISTKKSGNLLNTPRYILIFTILSEMFCTVCHKLACVVYTTNKIKRLNLTYSQLKLKIYKCKHIPFFWPEGVFLVVFLRIRSHICDRCTDLNQSINFISYKATINEKERPPKDFHDSLLLNSAQSHPRSSSSRGRHSLSLVVSCYTERWSVVCWLTPWAIEKIHKGT